MHTLNTLAILIFILCIVSVKPTKAQETNESPIQEIGVGVRNFSENFSLIYKRQIDEHKYRRYGGSLSLSAGEVAFLNISFSIATEKRKFLNDQLKFVRGLGYGLSFQTNFETEPGLNRFIPFVNYQLGIQYDIRDNFYVGASTFPSFNLLLIPGENLPTANLRVDLSAQLSAIFRF